MSDLRTHIIIDPPEPITIEIPPTGANGRSVHPVGEWSEEETYVYLNLVTYENGSYIATASEVPAGTLPTDTDYWQLNAVKGEKGDKGDTGDTGNGISSIIILSETAESRIYRITFTNGSTFDYTVLNGLKGDKGEKGDKGDPGEVTQEDLDTALYDKLDTQTETFSGDIVTFESENEYPLKNLTVAIEPVQEGSGDPSLENIRPIIGWTGVNVTVSPTLDAQDGDTYSIDWTSEAGTVYGGTLDVTTGELVVDMASVDLGTLDWNRTSTSVANKYRFKCAIPTEPKTADSRNVTALCSNYLLLQSGSTYRALEDGFTISSTDKMIYIYDESKCTMTNAEFKAAMSGVQLVYELAEPIIYHLTPVEITALLGMNNIWADTGDSTVEHRLSVGKMAFQDAVDYSMIAPVEAEMIATRNYTAGQFLIVGARFYKVTANIASGGSITVGTNVAQTTIAEQLILLANQ